jgi:hypothetical protein
VEKENWAGTRGEPNDVEAQFIELLEQELPLGLDYLFWEDGRGPWMVAALSFIGGPRGNTLIRTLRLDFDSTGICGGWSPDNMGTDADVRAERAGVSIAPPAGISVSAASSSPAEIAHAAAGWFQRHWDEWIRAGRR